MTFNHFNRRLHLYLALVLFPWFLMYGLSSLPFSHSGLFDGFYRDGVPPWTKIIDKPYEISLPDGNELRPVGEKIVKDLGLEGSFGTYREGNKLSVYVYTFRKSTQVQYYIDQKRITVEIRRFRWDHFFTGMHARGGFEHAGPIEFAWAITIDLVCVGFLLWIASGLYMWWHYPGHRQWGWLALGGGAASFAFLLLKM
jgi:hypothetical protein